MSSSANGGGNAALRDRLRSSGVPAEVADACSKLFTTETEARQFIGSESDTGTGFKSPWKEYFSIRYKRYYYCNDINGSNVWDIPQPIQLQQWIVDSEMYHLDITLVAALFRKLLWLLSSQWHAPELWDTVQILAKIVNNIVGCNNTNEKYRHIKLDNPKIRSTVLALPGATDILQAAGFKQTSEEFVYPATVTPMMMSAATLLASRLQTLSDRRGFTGEAKPADDPENGAAQYTKWHSQPGFKYQQDIFECSVCGQPINDGSERLYTRSHDSPVGQYRYQCEHQSCQSGTGFNLCEQCWDVHNKDGGGHLHPRDHTFQIHHPRTSRYQVQGNSSNTNPWGVMLGAGQSAARARERLRERYGM